MTVRMVQECGVRVWLRTAMRAERIMEKETGVALILHTCLLSPYYHTCTYTMPEQ